MFVYGDLGDPVVQLFLCLGIWLAVVSVAVSLARRLLGRSAAVLSLIFLVAGPVIAPPYIEHKGTACDALLAFEGSLSPFLQQQADLMSAVTQMQASPKGDPARAALLSMFDFKAQMASRYRGIPPTLSCSVAYWRDRYTELAATL